MKVVAINGSPKKEGNTYHALKLVADELKTQGIDTEIIHVGNKTLRGCLACGICIKTQDEKCVIKDEVNEIIQQMKDADAILLGSPVYSAAISGTMKAFLDRAFYVANVNNSLFRHKVGASVVAARRSGGLPAFNQLNNFLDYSEILIPTSKYWNVIHGRDPKEVLQDEEGKQIMKVLAKNMAWLMKLVENGKGKVEEPQFEEKVSTPFIK